MPSRTLDSEAGTDLEAIDDKVKAGAGQRVGAPAGGHDAPVARRHFRGEARPVAHQDLVECLRSIGASIHSLHSVPPWNSRDTPDQCDVGL